MSPPMLLSRRRFLPLLGAPFVAPWLAPSAADAAGSTKTLVVLFLRGGMDGLSAVAPYAHRGYRAARPRIAVPPPGKKGGAIPLVEGFGLHPALAPLEAAWRAKELAVVHAAGLPVTQRSHFEAQDLMESGTIDGVRDDGWAGRLRGRGGLFEAVAMQDSLPLALRGEVDALALGRALKSTRKAGRRRLGVEDLRALYATGDEPLRRAGRRALDALDQMRPLLKKPARDGVKYPKGAAGAGLFAVARLVEAQVGLRIAWIDVGGWDTHSNQGDPSKGRLTSALAPLGAALAAFRADLDARLEDVVVTVTTEFGRTWSENGSRGTDHGRGSVFMAMGGPIRGGRMLGGWPIDDPSFDGRELPVVTDTRDLFAELVRGHLGVKDLRQPFPGLSPKRVGLLG